MFGKHQLTSFLLLICIQIFTLIVANPTATINKLSINTSDPVIENFLPNTNNKVEVKIMTVKNETVRNNNPYFVYTNPNIQEEVANSDDKELKWTSMTNQTISNNTSKKNMSFRSPLKYYEEDDDESQVSMTLGADFSAELILSLLGISVCLLVLLSFVAVEIIKCRSKHDPHGRLKDSVISISYSSTNTSTEEEVNKNCPLCKQLKMSIQSNSSDMEMDQVL